MKKILAISGTIIILLTGCVSIKQVKEDPQAYSGKDVIVRGTITNIINIPFMEASIFIFEDKQDSVVVLSPRNHQKGERLTLKAGIVAFPEEDAGEVSEAVVRSIADFLVEHNFTEKKDAKKGAENTLKALRMAAKGLGHLFFAIEK